ncbi:MAG: division/cell wall cluster transcriptional repressor MraZ [Hyphomicrobiales bacterium]|nr:division/cell wall cluster transcriptional repressor MraZ [Hyphomicrobiales bacterium]MCP5371203.1 division/cell wall cluster transcriptional repressor MraZ [Hyphomicrobiales bacterium]
MPKPFRDVFQGQGFVGLYAYPSFKYPAIEAMGEDFMARLVAAIDDLPLYSEERDDLSAIVENTHRLPCDTEGRVVLPPELLDHAGITGEALFAGRGGALQIWDPATYARDREPAFERARARGVTLRLPPQQPRPVPPGGTPDSTGEG